MPITQTEPAPLRMAVISPGLVDTLAYDSLSDDTKSAMFDSAAKSLPVGRTGRLLDIDGGARAAL